MSRLTKKIKITAAVPSKVDNQMRRQALSKKINLGEMLEIYQDAYNEKLEIEKRDKQLKRELQEKGKVKCPYCSQMVVNE